MLTYTEPQRTPGPSASPLPRHIAVIMDGNGRWAQQRGLPRLAGHRAGTENIHRVVRATLERGVPYLTIYAFSTENWSRPREEVRGLFGILAEVIHRETSALHKQGVQIRHLGSLEGLPAPLRGSIVEAIELTKANRRLVLAVAFNYGGRREIVAAVQRIVREGLSPEEITEELVSARLSTDGLPDPDLIIRTGGEVRLSNFLIWQAAYSEYYATPTLWPDFGPEDLAEALAAYCQRQRRFGGLAGPPTQPAPLPTA
ncbi:MAG: di-trans,poly-cis-decaprenylcistransferase [Dehalococcoidia bacterium]|nr:di-trans,poly-cis-decaprenylcistransferase [Dehalococcoidia bacterium]